MTNLNYHDEPLNYDDEPEHLPPLSPKAGKAKLHIQHKQGNWKLTISRSQIPMLASVVDIHVGRERINKIEYAQGVVLALAPVYRADPNDAFAAYLLYTAAAYLLANGVNTASSKSQDVAYCTSVRRYLRAIFITKQRLLRLH